MTSDQKKRMLANDGCGLAAIASTSETDRFMVLKNWVTSRLAHLAEAGSFIDSVLSSAVNTGKATFANVMELCNDYAQALPDGRIVQFENVNVSGNRSLKIWVGEAFTELPFTLNATTSEVTFDFAEAGSETGVDVAALEGLRETLSDHNDEAVEYLEYLSGVFNVMASGASDAETLIAGGVTSTVAPVKEVASILASTPIDARQDALTAYTTTIMNDVATNISYAIEDDDDAGEFDPADYNGYETMGPMAGAFSIVMNGFTAIGSLLMIVGTPVLRVVGFVATGLAQIANWLIQRATSDEYMTVSDKSSSLEFANAFRCSFTPDNASYNPSIRGTAYLSDPGSSSLAFSENRDRCLSNPAFTIMHARNSSFNPTGSMSAFTSGLVYPKAAGLIAKDEAILQKIMVPGNDSHGALTPINTFLSTSVRQVSGSVPSGDTWKTWFNRTGALQFGIHPGQFQAAADRMISFGDRYNEAATKGDLVSPWMTQDTRAKAEKWGEAVVFRNILLALYGLAASNDSLYRAAEYLGPSQDQAYSDQIPTLSGSNLSQKFLNLMCGTDYLGNNNTAYQTYGPRLQSLWYTLDEKCRRTIGIDANIIRDWIELDLVYAIASQGTAQISDSLATSNYEMKWEYITKLMNEDITFLGFKKINTNFPQYPSIQNSILMGEVAKYIWTHQDDQPDRWDWFISNSSFGDLMLAIFSEGLCYLHAAHRQVAAANGPNQSGTFYASFKVGGCGVVRTSPIGYDSLRINAPLLGPATSFHDYPHLVSDPLITPPKYSRGSTLGAVVLFSIVVATTVAASLVARRKVRDYLRTKMVQREKEAKDATERLENMDTRDPGYKQAVNQYVRSQRRFQRYANFIGYSSNNVGSYGSSGRVSNIFSSLRDQMTQFGAVDSSPYDFSPDIVALIKGN